VFGASEKKHTSSYDDEDDDPIIDDLRIIDYRYMRFSYHSLKDRFVLCNGWKDPAWTDVKSIRAGIDGDEKESRDIAFGKNLIDMKQKTILQLLVDEVCTKALTCVATSLLHRLFIHSMYSKLPVSFSGPSMSTTTMRLVFSSFLS